MSWYWLLAFGGAALLALIILALAGFDCFRRVKAVLKDAQELGEKVAQTQEAIATLERSGPSRT